MMNFLAICLVLSSLAAAGVWSPSPAADHNKHNTNKKDDVIVKEGHRVVVVEYDQQGKHNTKVLISPAAPSDVEQKISSAASDALNNARDRIREASSVLPDLGQGLSYGDEGRGHGGPGPKELICDAYGKCKHKIASAIEKAKDKVSGVAHDAAAAKKEMAYEAQEMAHEAKDFVQDALGKAKKSAAEKAHGAKEAAKDAFGKAKDTAYEKSRGAKEAAKESVEKAKGNLKEAKDLSKTIGEDVAGNVSEQVENARESIGEKAKEAKQGAEHVAKRVKTGVRNFFVRFGQFLNRFLRYLGFPEPLNGLMGVLNLLGFATAYGMSVWVTFISSYALAGALPRQQFGMVQSKIYPVYFRAMACSIGLALLGHIPQFSSKAGMFQGYNLLASILMVLTNSMYLEPRATKVMFERTKVEKEEGRGRESVTGETSSSATEQRAAADPAAATTTTSTAAATTAPENLEQEANIRTKMVRLSERLKKLNTYSSILNVLTLMCLTLHLVYLGQSLHMTC